MGRAQSIAKRLTAAARLLALAAALVLAVGVHPPHAAAAAANSHAGISHRHLGEHSHFSAACLQADLDQAQLSQTGAAMAGHADCFQVFVPLLRPADSAAPDCVRLDVVVPHDLPFRQLVTSFDPPPPRRG